MKSKSDIITYTDFFTHNGTVHLVVVWRVSTSFILHAVYVPGTGTVRTRKIKRLGPRCHAKEHFLHHLGPTLTKKEHLPQARKTKIRHTALSAMTPRVSPCSSSFVAPKRRSPPKRWTASAAAAAAALLLLLPLAVRADATCTAYVHNDYRGALSLHAYNGWDPDCAIPIISFGVNGLGGCTSMRCSPCWAASSSNRQTGRIHLTRVIAVSPLFLILMIHPPSQSTTPSALTPKSASSKLPARPAASAP